MGGDFDADKISIKSLRVYYDDKTQTRVKEKPFLVQYESQHFRCKATLQVEESMAKSHWTIGLVQACDGMTLENRYGQFGSSLWEFHPLKARYHEMVNDSDGRQYPFYSMSTSKVELPRGPVAAAALRLHYGDHFYPTVAWQLPYCGGVQLTDVIRRQDFWVWLVAIRRHRQGGDQFNASREQIFVLRTMRWRYNLHLSFDPTQRLGCRLRSVSDSQHELPVVMETDAPVPLSAVHPPHCNAAQSLIWYPTSQRERPALLVPPKQTIVPWSRWVSDMIPAADQTQLRRPPDLRLCPLWSCDSPTGIHRTSRVPDFSDAATAAAAASCAADARRSQPQPLVPRKTVAAVCGRRGASARRQR